MIKKIFGFFGRDKKSKGEKQIKMQIDLDKKLVFSLSKSRMPTFGQSKYIFRYLGRKEKGVFIGLIFLLLLSLGFLTIKFYLNNTKIVPDFGGEYVEGLVGEPQYINPILAQTNDVDMDLSKLIFSGLFKYNEQQELIPDLALKSEISEDKKIYTITLKEDIFWHDGKSLSANDIIFTFLSIQDFSFKSPLYSSFRDIGVERLDDKTIVFTLKNPYLPFLGTLTFGILPEHLWKNIPPQSANLAEYNIKPIGSGPFQFKSFTKDKNGSIKKYTLERNEKFYGQKPYLSKLIFKFYSDFTSAVNALHNQNIEGISFLPREFKDSFKGDRIKKYYLDLPQYTALFFNQRNSSLLKSENIRLAISFGLDKLKLTESVLGQGGKTIYGPILIGQTGYTEDLKKNDFNLTKAVELLDKEDFKLAEDGLRKKKEEVLKVSITTVDNEDYLAVADFAKKNWEALGMQVEIKVVPAAEIQRKVIEPRDYEILLFGTMAGVEPDPFPFWHSSQVADPGLNLALYANRKADKLLEEARQTENPEEKAKKYIEFQNILLEDNPAIFLYSANYTYAVSEDVLGISIERIGIPSNRFIGIESWHKETKRIWK